MFFMEKLNPVKIITSASPGVKIIRLNSKHENWLKSSLCFAVYNIKSKFVGCDDFLRKN